MVPKQLGNLLRTRAALSLGLFGMTYPLPSWYLSLSLMKSAGPQVELRRDAQHRGEGGRMSLPSQREQRAYRYPFSAAHGRRLRCTQLNEAQLLV